MTLRKIVSGGQTGADQAGLDAAIKHGIPHGGWIPKGRLTEDGGLSEKYHLMEMPIDSYPKRTEQNVVDSDGTVIFTHGSLTGGSLHTRKKAIQHNKPVLHLDLKMVTIDEATEILKEFIDDNNIEILNIAGSRASKDGLIYGKVYEVVYCSTTGN
jgi:hypothetical protein